MACQVLELDTKKIACTNVMDVAKYRIEFPIMAELISVN